MMTPTVRILLLTICLACQCPHHVTWAGDPLNWGPYKVGVRTEVFVDESRDCGITKEPRTLVTEIWYPATDAADEHPLNTFADYWSHPNGVPAGHLAMMAFGGRFEKINENFKNVARRNSDLHDGEFPLLIFSHGNGGLRHQNTFQAEYLASHGYIVAAPDHTGNATVTVLPDRIVAYNADTRKSEQMKDDRPNDVSFLITHLTSLATSTDYWIAGGLSAKAIGVFGHSFGGYTTCRVTELDDRIKAIIPMTLAISTLPKKKYGKADEQDKPLMPADIGEVGEVCSVPLLLILGDTDRTVEEKGNMHSLKYYEQATGPKYLLNFKDAGHFTFTEMPQLNPDFGDGVGVERDKEGNVTFTFSDATEDQRITNVYSVAFFDTFLKQDKAAAEFLDKDHFPEQLMYCRD